MPDATCVEASVEVGAPLEWECGLPEGMLCNAQEVQCGVEIQPVPGETQLLQLAPTTEVAKANIEVGASPPLESEHCECGAAADAGELNVQKVEPDNIHTAFEPQQVTVKVDVSAPVPDAMCVEALVEVCVSPGLETGIPEGSQCNPHEVPFAVQNPPMEHTMESDETPLREVAPTTEVAKAYVEVDASTVVESELFDGAPTEAGELNVQNVEVPINNESSFEPEEVRDDIVSQSVANMTYRMEWSAKMFKILNPLDDEVRTGRADRTKGSADQSR